MINYCIIKNHATKYEWYHSTMTRLKMLYKVYVSFIFVKILFSCCFFFLGKNFWERDCATLLKMKFLKYIFQGFWLKISPGNFQNSCLLKHLFFQNISVAASKLCLAQLDYALYCVFNPPCCFVVFTLVIKFNFRNGWFKHCKAVLGMWDKD